MGLDSAVYKQIFVTESGLFDEVSFEAAVQEANSTRRPLEQILRDNTYLDDEQYLSLLADHFNTTSAPLKLQDIDTEVMLRLPQDFAIEHNVLAYAVEGETVLIAVLDPTNESFTRDISWRVGGECKFFVTTPALLRRAFILYDGNLEDRVAKLTASVANAHTDKGVSMEQLNPIVDDMIETAVLVGASDIHIEPYETEIIIRFRVDGLLRSIVSIPPIFKDAFVSILKIRSELKLDQRRLPQDGRFSFDVKGQSVNIRVSSLPSMWGEKIVLRILIKNARSFSFSSLGLLPGDLELVKAGLKEPNGMILVTGPTGAGKTSSLYAFLQEIGRDKIEVVNISTVEDPIEYTIPRVTQMQINPSIDLTFAAGLRALLRQDPDIIMVGEVRDTETARFAIQAALVGRLVLSSLHTNDAPASIPRLLDMGAEPYLVSSTLKLVVAQRLARRLCKYCRQSYSPDAADQTHLSDHYDMKRALKKLTDEQIISSPSLEDARFYKAVGCDRCNGSGYAGRIGIFEVMVLNKAIITDINSRRDASTIRETAINGGMKTLFEDGLAKIILGEIDLSELLRVVYS